MASTWRATILLLFVATAVSGCANSETGKATGAAPSGFTESALAGETGTITGTVTSDELLPIQGAVVGVLGIDLVTATDGAGEYSIPGVPAGTHVVSAQALGFESAAQKVTIAVDAVATVSFQLPPLPTDEPYLFTDIKKSTQRTIVFKLTPQCIHTSDPLVTTCNGVRFNCAPSGACEVHYANRLDKDPNWRTIVGEVDWRPQSATTGKAFLFDINAPGIMRGAGGSIVQNDPKTFSKMSGKAPILIRIDNSTTLEERKIPPQDWCCDWFWRLFTGWCDLGSIIGNCETTPDYGIAIDNPATVYFTIAFREPAPQGFTALRDA